MPQKYPKRHLSDRSAIRLGRIPWIRHGAILYILSVCTGLLDCSAFADSAKFCFVYLLYYKVCTNFISPHLMRGVSAKLTGGEIHKGYPSTSPWSCVATSLHERRILCCPPMTREAYIDPACFFCLCLIYSICFCFLIFSAPSQFQHIPESFLIPHLSKGIGLIREGKSPFPYLCFWLLLSHDKSSILLPAAGQGKNKKRGNAPLF